MSARGLSFVEDWIQKNVTAGEREGDAARTAVLADRCRQEAAGQGIAEDELESEYGSLETVIYGAIVHLTAPGMPGD